MHNLTNTSEYEHNLMLWSLFLKREFGKGDPVWLQVTISTVLLMIFVVGLVGNILTCIVIYSDRRMHTATNLYILNMAVSDAVVSFAIFLEVHLFLTKSYFFEDVVCKIHFFFVIGLWNNSILVMTALAIERYIAIWYPLKLKTPPWNRVMKVMTIIWIIAILETIPEVMTVDLIRTKQMSICFTVPSPFSRVVNGILAFVTFVVPLAIIIFVYTMIALKVNIAEKSNTKKKIFNHRDNRSKVNKLVVAMTLSFVICWLPFFTSRILIFLLDTRQLTNLDKIWNIGYKIVLVNSWFCIVLNPILFSLISTKFRKSFKMLWNKKFYGHQTEVINDI